MMGLNGAETTGGVPRAAPLVGGAALSADNPFGNGGLSPQLLRFASGALGGGGFQGGVGKLMGGLLAQRMRQQAQQQQSGNPLVQLFSGDPGAGGQPMA